MRQCERGNHIFEPGYECCRAVAVASEEIQKAGIAAFYDYLDALPDDKSRPTDWPYSPAHITNALLDCINAVVGAGSAGSPEPSEEWIAKFQDGYEQRRGYRPDKWMLREIIAACGAASPSSGEPQ